MEKPEDRATGAQAAIRLLTTAQTAKIVGRSVSTLAKARCLRSDGIPFVKQGASVRYLESDVLAYVAALPRRRSTSDTAAAA